METPIGHEQNADQIAYWNGPGGQRWADRQQVQDILLKPVADILIGRAQAKAGERIVDVGCGSGAVSIAPAKLHRQVCRSISCRRTRPFIRSTLQVLIFWSPASA